jgi:hypothetical protein
MTGEAISRAIRGRAQLRLERIRKDDLFFPTDGAALVFGVLIFSLVIFALDKQLLGDPDTYWHVATGKWILTERAFPRRDIFSHTALGQPWIDLEWLAQVILFESYDRFGWAGLILLCGFVISLTFVIMYEFLAAELRPTVALGASAISFLFASDHYLARPHLLTLPIIVVWTVILSRASTEKCSPPLWLLPLMTLWANLHGGFTLGLLLAAGFGLESTLAAASSERRRVALGWSAFWVGALLASCLTPYGYYYALQTFRVLELGKLLPQIQELRPMNPHLDILQELILVSLLAMALLSGAKLGLVRVLMIIVLLHLALQHVRGLAIFALVLPFLLAHPLQQQFAFLRPTRDPFPLFQKGRFRSRATIALAASLLVTAVVGGVYATLRRDEAPSDDITPAAAVDYSLTKTVTGPVLNDFDFGGYLIFRGIPTFIDGRTLPFGEDFVLAYADAITPGDGSKLDYLADKHKISWTLLRPKSVAALHFDHSAAWRRLYVDDLAVVHVRR